MFVRFVVNKRDFEASNVEKFNVRGVRFVVNNRDFDFDASNVEKFNVC